MKQFIRPALLAGIAVSTVIGVVACGGGASPSTNSTSAAAATATPSAAASSSAGGGARNNPFADPTVQQCLKAAGIAVPTFTRPTGSFTRPSGSFTRPSGSFTRARPTGSFTRPVGGFGGFGTNSPDFQKIEQALTACGITLPTFGGRGGFGGGAPASSASPSS